MVRRSSFPAFAVIVLAAAGLEAQSPQPTGMMSPTRPALLTNDGVPDGTGDQVGTILKTPGNVTLFETEFGGADCNGQGGFSFTGQPGGGSGPINEFGRGGPSEAFATNLDTSDPTQPRPTRGHYDELGQGVVTGDLDLIDDDGDHRYERATVNGSRRGNGVAVDLDLVPADPDGDEQFDYVTLSSLQPLGFFGMNCDTNDVPTDYDQVWLPLARDLDGDYAVIADLDGNSEADPDLLWGPKLQFGAIPPPSVLEVPTISRFGVAVLALVLLALGIHLLRRRAPAAGA